MIELSMLLCTHFLNSLIDFIFCMVMFISFFGIYYLKIESIIWAKYLTSCESCEFIISKGGCIFMITSSRAHFKLKWETWLNLVSYYVHIVSTLQWILRYIRLFVYLCYESNIWIWRFLTDQISYKMQVLWISHFKDLMYLQNTQITGTLLTEMGNMNHLSDFLCTHCLNSWVVFNSVLIFSKSLL